MRALYTFFIRWMAFLLVIFLALPASGLCRMLCFCATAQQVAAGCCCHHSGEGHSHHKSALRSGHPHHAVAGLLREETTKQVSAAECCKHGQSFVEFLDAEKSHLSMPDFLPVGLLVPMLPFFETNVLESERIRRSIPPRGPPARKPAPLFLKYCSFLE